MQRELARAVARISPVRVRVEADLRAFGHSIDTLANFPAASIAVVPDVDRAQFEAAIQAALTGLEVSVRVVPDLTGFDAAILAHNTPTVNVDVDANRSSLKRLTGALSGIGRAAGGALAIGSVGIAAASAAQGVFALTAALAPAAGALAALPAVIAGGAAAMVALKLATAGVGDALKAAASGDAEALADALEKLSPSAREAVSAFAALQPRLKALQQSVQEAFFSRFSGDVAGALKNLTPLQSALGGISAQFGRAASEALKFAASKEALAGLRGVLAGTHAALSGLAPATQPVLKGFLDVASAVSTAFGQRVGTALRDTASRFGDFLSVSAASGQAVAWVDGAVTVFKQLGAIASNVGGIISGVFGAANDVGGGLLNNLEQITSGMEAFVKSTQGQEAISGIFTALSAVAAQLVPILGAVVQTLGGIAPALAPLFTTIGPAIAGLISALGPALANIAPGLQALVGGLTGGLAAISESGAFEAIGAAIGSIATAIAPLLPVLGELIGQFTAALAPALTAVASALTPVIEALAGALMPVIGPLSGAVRTLVTALTPLVTIIGATLAQVIGAVAPLLGTLATLIAQIATAVAPLIAQLTDALVPVFAALAPAVAQVVAALIPLVTQLIDALLPVLPPIIDAFTAILDALLPLVPEVANLVTALAPLVALIITGLAPVIQFAAEIVKWTAINVVVPIIETLVSVIGGIIGVVGSVITAVSGFVTTIIQFFSNLKQNVTTVVTTLVISVVTLFKSIPGRALSALSALVGAATGVFNDVKAAVVQRVTSLVTDVVSNLRGLIGKAKSALSGASSALVSAGGDLIRGLISGVQAKAGELASAAKNVVKGAVDGVKNFLGIASPSKLFIGIGKFVGQGFVNGLTGQADSIRRAAEEVIGKIREAFKGRNSRLDDVLIAQVKSGEKQLLALAARRESIAARIKQANELATSVTQQALSTGTLQTVGEGAGGVQGITDGIEAAIKKVQGFNRQVASLARRGLRKDLLSQLIGLGPDQGAGLAKTLSNATGDQLKDLNEAQKQLAASAKSLGQTSADVLFDAGEQASKGFLAGLKAQQAELNTLMKQIGKQLASSIRTALGIHSPSTVMAGIGVNTMRGLENGVKARISQVRRVAVGAASAITEPFGADVGVGSARAARGRQAGAQGSGGGSRTTTNTFNVYEVGNAAATAERILNRLAAASGL